MPVAPGCESPCEPVHHLRRSSLKRGWLSRLGAHLLRAPRGWRGRGEGASDGRAEQSVRQRPSMAAAALISEDVGSPCQPVPVWAPGLSGSSQHQDAGTCGGGTVWSLPPDEPSRSLGDMHCVGSEEPREVEPPAQDHTAGKSVQSWTLGPGLDPSLDQVQEGNCWTPVSDSCPCPFRGLTLRHDSHCPLPPLWRVTVQPAPGSRSFLSSKD